MSKIIQKLKYGTMLGGRGINNTLPFDFILSPINLSESNHTLISLYILERKNQGFTLIR